jgi:hypothetical protein
VQAASGAAYLELAIPNAAAYYARAYLWVSSDLSVDDLSILYLGNAAATEGLNVDLRAGDALELYALHSKISKQSPRGIVPRDEWFCVTLSTEIGAASGASQGSLSLGNQELLRLESGETSGRDLPPAGLFELFTVGVDWSSKQQASGSIWFDDILLATSPLSCD